MIIPPYASFTHQLNPVDFGNKNLGYFDDGKCAACGATGVNTAHLNYSDLWICEDCWNKIAVFINNPAWFDDTKYFMRSSLSKSDVQEIVHFMKKEEQRKNLNRAKYSALVAAFTAEHS